jgi:hypothetical protein
MSASVSRHKQGAPVQVQRASLRRPESESFNLLFWVIETFLEIERVRYILMKSFFFKSDKEWLHIN